MINIKIIAEIGINHDGLESKAKTLIKSAASSGAHAIKFQYRNIDNAYSDTVREIGDEILLTEINKAYLSPETIISLVAYAKKNNLEVGISFFDEQDIVDFKEKIEIFDFFKIPSVELTNTSLIDALLKLNRHLYISVGAHSEKEIEAAFNHLPSHGWTPMHCISNYPVTLQNARIGYLQYLHNKWNCDIGYSSHDDNWEVCLLAMQQGATVIERHITLDRQAEGLDHSSSSTPDEFKKLSDFAENFSSINTGNSPRVPNQGELLNRQNLGRSFFAKVDLSAGHKLNISDVTYRSPNIGINKTDIESFLSKPIQKQIKAGSSITKGTFHKETILSSDIVEFSRNKRLSLPVRLHDLQGIEQLFPIGTFEFHLSYSEILSSIEIDRINAHNQYSIHLPDYINSTQLMDPFSPDIEQRKNSLAIIEKTVSLAEKLQELTGKDVPVVGSFSIVHNNRDDFFTEHANLLKSYLPRGVLIVPQWLPPIAWYFGGSVRLHTMNEEQDSELLKKHNLGVCLDLCHMILGRNYFQFSTDSIINSLDDQIKHIHIADAAGIDGEGLAIGEGESENLSLIRSSLDYPCMKVIEVWQGHFDNGAGFREALTTLSKV